MVGEFTAFIKNQTLFTENDTILLAVSGGIDSVVMAHLFAQSSYRFAIAHANFRLRGEASDEDEQWVAALAKKYQVPFHTQQFATSENANEQGISIQMAARQLRYDWFEKVQKEHNYAYLATAHHQDDQLETTLLNLCQGTGIAGLRGMLVRRGNVVRPMLFARRNRIEAYAREHQLTWREDRSNASDTYHRNRIRHHVIPQLQQINPSLLTTYQSTQERLLATEQLLANEVKRVEGQCRRDTDDEVWLDKAVLKKHSQLPLILGEILRAFGFSYVQSRDVARCVKSEAIAGKTFTSGAYTLVVDRQYLIISQEKRLPSQSLLIQSSDTQLLLPLMSLSFTSYAVKDYSLRPYSEVAAIDRDLLSFPLNIRPWQAGDWFYPLGMEHRKKVSDLLIDQKIPLHRKPFIQVITSAEAIVWVVDVRIDHRFRITDQTRTVYEISVTNSR